MKKVIVLAEKEECDKKIYETLSKAFFNLKDIIDHPDRKYTLNKREFPDMTIYYKTPVKESK